MKLNLPLLLALAAVSVSAQSSQSSGEPDPPTSGAPATTEGDSSPATTQLNPDQTGIGVTLDDSNGMGADQTLPSQSSTVENASGNTPSSGATPEVSPVMSPTASDTSPSPQDDTSTLPAGATPRMIEPTFSSMPKSTTTDETAPSPATVETTPGPSPLVPPAASDIPTSPEEERSAAPTTSPNTMGGVQDGLNPVPDTAMAIPSTTSIAPSPPFEPVSTSDPASPTAAPLGDSLGSLVPIEGNGAVSDLEGPPVDTMGFDKATETGTAGTGEERLGETSPASQGSLGSTGSSSKPAGESFSSTHGSVESSSSTGSTATSNALDPTGSTGNDSHGPVVTTGSIGSGADDVGSSNSTGEDSSVGDNSLESYSASSSDEDQSIETDSSSGDGSDSASASSATADSQGSESLATDDSMSASIRLELLWTSAASLAAIAAGLTLI